MNRATSRLVERLIRNISHEIKNPLTSIKGYAQLLLLKPDDRELLNKSQLNIVKQIEYMESMLNNLYRIFMLKETLVKNIDLPVELRSFVDRFRSIYPNKIEFHCSDNDHVIAGSVEYFRNILDLIINGVDWQHQKSINVIISLGRDDSTSVLSITMNGADFSDMDKDIYFLPFYSRKYYANGTSLYEADMLATISGWNLSINNNSNGFIIRFDGKKL